MMNNKQLYNGIKRWIYRKLNQLEVTERNDGKMLFLRQGSYIQIIIIKDAGEVICMSPLYDKIHKLTPLKEIDVKIFVKMWVEETFNIEVKHIDQRSFYSDVLLNNI